MALNVNGVDEDVFKTLHSFVRTGIWFTDFDPSSLTYIYNDAGESALNSGLMDIKDIVYARTLYISVPVLNSTSITIRVEVKPAFALEWFEVNTQIFTTATTVGKLWPILEYAGNIRVGILVVGPVAGDEVNVSGEFSSQLK